MKTFTLKAGMLKQGAQYAPEWHLIDATGVRLGRLASFVAKIITGKTKPIFSPHMDCGDHVVIINAEKIDVTGKKLDQKVFHWHTGYPGGIKERTLKETLEGRFPERAMIKAVERMINRNPLGRLQMKKLHVYQGANHPHAPQSPKVLDFAAMNPKNKRV